MNQEGVPNLRQQKTREGKSYLLRSLMRSLDQPTALFKKKSQNKNCEKTHHFQQPPGPQIDVDNSPE